MRGHQRPKMNSWVLAGLFFAISGYGMYKVVSPQSFQSITLNRL